ncbi:hypothetical protein BGX26_008091, partial [Mortierella sp. AD094]
TSGLVDEEDDAADLLSVTTDQQSLGSVSTFDLPSPALSSTGAEMWDKKTDKGAVGFGAGLRSDLMPLIMSGSTV